MMNLATEQEVREWLAGAIMEADEDACTRTFAEAGLFTNNEGLVLRFASGAGFQLTIVRSKWPV
jgi:hypothetical protein